MLEKGRRPEREREGKVKGEKGRKRSRGGREKEKGRRRGKEEGCVWRGYSREVRLRWTEAEGKGLEAI